MKSYQTNIPANSLTKQYLPADYTDAFACEVAKAKSLSADEVMIKFWTVSPRWIDSLFKLRNVLVRPFGLETGEEENRTEKLKEMIRSGNGSSRIMSVVAKSSHETVVLLSDKHLDAYMSVVVEEGCNSQIVTAITLVHYHNKLGKVYFFFVRPFHKVIVKSMLKSTLK